VALKISEEGREKEISLFKETAAATERKEKKRKHTNPKTEKSISNLGEGENRPPLKRRGTSEATALKDLV